MPMRHAAKGFGIVLLVCLVVAVMRTGEAPAQPAGPRPSYRSPVDLAHLPDGKTLAVVDRTASQLVFIDIAQGKPVRSAQLKGKLNAVALSGDGSKAYVSQYESDSIAEVNCADAKVLRQIKSGARPVGVAIAPKANLLLTANSAFGEVSIIDIASGNEKAKVKVSREPFAITVSPDEKTAVVSNLLPAGPASDPQTSSNLSIINLSDDSVTNIKLPPNATAVRQTAVSPDNKWAYVVHTVGRSTLPATQLDRGWVITNAISVIDLTAKAHYATLLLDNLSEGAADPWGLALSKDGGTAWITLSGAQQIAKLDLAKLHPLMAGNAPETTTPKGSYGSPRIWADIKADQKKRADLVNDLAALHIAQAITRVTLPGKGARGVAVSPADGKVAVAQYFTGDVLVIDPQSVKVTATIAVAQQPAADEARRGEQIFHDANYTFQKWLSCGSCHPNEGRVDALNWDLPNDGIGNPKNNKSLLQADKTAPSMWTGVREGMDLAAAAGFRFGMQVAPEKDIEATRAYIRSLTPEKSPYRVNGELSEKAKRGKAIFEADTSKCAKCHPGPLFTDQKQHDVGTFGQLDHAGQTTFDTPSLVEVWRTAPYLHDGRSATLKELFTTLNKEDKHGATSKLTPEQVDDLVEYLQSLE